MSTPTPEHTLINLWGLIECVSCLVLRECEVTLDVRQDHKSKSWHNHYDEGGRVNN